jgi:uncharacterized protein YggU (UPF0235/DUF167 family)
VEGIIDGSLRVRVRAAAVDGAANAALIELLAQQLGVRRSSVVIVRGTTSRAKLVALSEDAAYAANQLWPALLIRDG